MLSPSYNIIASKLPYLVFVLGLLGSGFLLGKLAKEPIRYQTQITVPSGSEKWLAFVASENQIQKSINKYNLDTDQIVNDVSEEKQTLPGQSSKIQLISRSLNSSISVRPSRQQNSHIIVTLDHAKPAIIDSFIKPLFTHLQSQYYAGWDAVYNKTQRSYLNINPTLALASYAPPSSDFITYKTNQFMLSGSPFLATPLTSQKAHMSYRYAVFMSVLFAFASAILTFLLLRYKEVVIRYIFSQDN
jgi:hypothetical protein